MKSTLIAFALTMAPLAAAATDLHPNSHVIYELNLYNYTAAGTLQAATERIDELKDLGVDVVWLMPIHPRGKTDRIGTLGSPYAPSDYTAVNPDFGTLDDLRQYVAAAHERGMQVWLDWVPNHTGTDHVWTKDHRDYYNMRNGGIAHPNNYGDVYELNYSNSALQDAMISAMNYWVDEADIDGFRCDYVSSPTIPTSFWTKATAAVREHAGKDITFLGEADMNNMNDLRSRGWDYDYAWGFQSKLVEFGNSATANSKLKPILQSLTDNAKYGTVSRMVYLTNHDQNYDHSLGESYGANVYPLTAIMMTLYGMPCIYNGQENGYLYDNKQDYFNRRAIDWTRTDAKMTSTLRVLGRLHHVSGALADDDALRVGGVKYLDCNKATCLAYTRKRGTETVLVVVNLSNNEITVNVSGLEAGTWQCVANSKTIASQPAPVATELATSADFTVEGKGYMVYTLGTDVSDLINGIAPVQREHPASSITYDLQGRRLAQPAKGISIAGGRKIIR